MKRKGRRAKLGLIKPAGVEPETWTMLTAARGGGEVEANLASSDLRGSKPLE